MVERSMPRDREARAPRDDQIVQFYRPSEYEVAYLSRKTGKMAIEVRRTMMRVGNDPAKVEAALKAPA